MKSKKNLLNPPERKVCIWFTIFRVKVGSYYKFFFFVYITTFYSSLLFRGESQMKFGHISRAILFSVTCLYENNKCFIHVFNIYFLGSFLLLIHIPYLNGFRYFTSSGWENWSSRSGIWSKIHGCPPWITFRTR